ncbi:MAG: hypothetical protein WCA16_00570, partial [Candidatus Sulfotelmatobacter sp.]
AKANLIRGLADNQGLAIQLATYQTRYGDWRELFDSVDRIDKVTKADIRRVANEIFVDTNRTVGMIENAAQAQKDGSEPSSGRSGSGAEGSRDSGASDRRPGQATASQGGAQ